MLRWMLPCWLLWLDTGRALFSLPVLSLLSIPQPFSFSLPSIQPRQDIPKLYHCDYHCTLMSPLRCTESIRRWNYDVIKMHQKQNFLRQCLLENDRERWFRRKRNTVLRSRVTVHGHDLSSGELYTPVIPQEPSWNNGPVSAKLSPLHSSKITHLIRQTLELGAWLICSELSRWMVGNLFKIKYTIWIQKLVWYHDQFASIHVPVWSRMEEPERNS